MMDKSDKPWLSEEYRRYIKSTAWKSTRREALVRRGKACEKCGSTSNLEVDHLNYNNLGNENIATDLQILCAGCHAKVTDQRSQLRLWWARFEGFCRKVYGEDWREKVDMEEAEERFERWIDSKDEGE